VIALFAIFTCLLRAHPLLAAGSAPRVEVPIVRHILSNGDIRFSVSVRVGGGPLIEAMLDTGSFGLRVLARAMAPSQYEVASGGRAFGFGSGLVLQGPLAKAVVSIGGMTTDGPISIQVVQVVNCRASKPNCLASRSPPDAYRIGGDGLPHEGFDAILGLAMLRSDGPGFAANPLAVSGSRRWIVSLPRPGGSSQGRLVVNPGTADLVGFHKVWLRPKPAGAEGKPQVVGTEIANCPDKPLEVQASCPTMTLVSGSWDGIWAFNSYDVLFDAESREIWVRSR